MSGKLDNSIRVTVFGGSGFVGRHLCAALAKTGARVIAACRRPDLAGHLQPLGGVGQIQPVQANIRYPDSIKKAIAGADMVVNLVSILAPSGKQTFKSVHVEGARNIAAAAAEAGIRDYVYMSAIGASAYSRSEYGRTKAAAEQATLDAIPSAIVMRPSVIFGPEDEFFNRFAEMATMAPVLPAFGNTKFQPVYVGDVADATVAALDGRAKAGTIYELGGPEILTFTQVLERVSEYTDRDRSVVKLPLWFAKLAALGTWPLPNSLRPITMDQVQLLKSDNVVSPEAIAESRTLEGLGIQPRAIEGIVPQYMEPYRPRGQYARYRNT